MTNPFPRAVFCCLLAMLPGAGMGVELSESETGRLDESPVTKYDRDHWSFRSLGRTEVPGVQRPGWALNPVDEFIQRRLEDESLRSMPPAGRATLIRRVTFDLTGLPPTREEIDDFVRDTSPDAYERVVDRLLGSARYGQRWAQYWLDLARFAETDGFEHDKVRPDAWRYRDWVIEALNQDMPYDRFLHLQLAGDETGVNEPGNAIATYFCLSGPDMPDINSQDERRHNLLNEITGTVGATLLGLQLGCAECHDHKYDPISQADFYRLRAVFEPAIRVEKNQSISVLSEDGSPPAASYLMIRGDWQRKGPPVAAAFPRIANPWNEQLPPADPQAATSGRRTALARWLTRPDHPLTARVMANRLWQHHFGEGICGSPSDFGVMGEEPTHPELLDWLAAELVRCGWSLKSMHRLIVTSATYRQASRPVERDWTSSQRDAAGQSWAEAVQRDPQNRLLARYPRRRLEGEAIRDAMLTAAGTLNETMGGPGVMPPLPAELVGTLLKDQWKASPSAADHHRRSVYVFARRNLRFPIFDVFDRPEANASCPRRGHSTTAPQSLLLFNSAFSLQTARHLAGRVLSEAADGEGERIGLCFVYTLGRRPTDEELEMSRDFLTRQQRLLLDEGRPESELALPIPLPRPAASDPQRAAALTDLCLALLNSSEFLYLE